MPTLIEKPKVGILNELNDTTKRQFPVETVLQLTCKGQIGSDPNNVCIYTNFRRITSANVHVNITYICCGFRRSDGVFKRKMKRYSQNWTKPLSTPMRLLMEVSISGPVLSLTA